MFNKNKKRKVDKKKEIKTPTSDKKSSNSFFPSFLNSSNLSSFSSNSPIQNLGANVSSTPVIISLKIDLDEVTPLMFYIPSQTRVDTNNDSQGDHVTPYRIFLELISAGIDNQKPKEVMQSLFNIAKSFFPNDKLKILEGIKSRYEKKWDKDGFEQNERKVFTGFLDRIIDHFRNEKLIKSQKIDKEKIEKNKRAIKRSNYTIIGGCVSEMATQIILETNKLGYMTFPKTRKGNKKEQKKEEINRDKSEGTRVRRVIKILKSLDTLFLINDMAQNKISTEKILIKFISDIKFKSKKEKYYINGLSYFFEENETLKSTLKNFLKKGKRVLNKDNIREILALKMKEKWNVFLKDILRNNNTTKMIGELIEDLFDYRAVTEESENDYNILCLSCARHLVIIFQSFQNISKKISIEQKESIAIAFISKVFENQGWRNYTYSSLEDHLFPVNLKKDDLIKDVKSLTKDYMSLLKHKPEKTKENKNVIKQNNL